MARSRLRLGYLVPEFPGQTHIFFWREICALREMGVEVFPISTQKPSPITCRHEFAAAAIAETRYLFPPAWLSVFKRAIWSDGTLSSAFEYLRELSQRGVGKRLRAGALLLSALDLAAWANEHDINHIHGHSCADAAHVLALARRLGGPTYSLTLHGDLAVYGGDHKLKMREAAFVSAVGSHLRRELIEHVGLPESRVLVSFMGIDAMNLATFGDGRTYTVGRLHLATVARLHPMKGHIHAINAIYCGVQAGLDLHYTIAGEGPYHGALLKHIQELGLQDRITLTGTLSETEVFDLLSRVDAFLLPSTGVGEAWPVSVMEAMGAGLPVIASIIGATPEMITSGVDGFLVPQADETAIAEKLALMAQDLDLRRRMGAAARVTAERRFGVTETAARLKNAVLASAGG